MVRDKSLQMAMQLPQQKKRLEIYIADLDRFQNQLNSETGWLSETIKELEPSANAPVRTRSQPKPKVINFFNLP